MRTIGLLGTEFDRCLRLLKTRIEDHGHIARVINLTHLPRVTRVSVEFDKLIYDGYNLLEMGSFYLKELGIRDPFFHVSYERDLWIMLRERYMAHVEAEEDNVIFTCNLLEILASRVPVVNHPQVYSHRTLVPLHLNVLAQNGLSVPPFVTEHAEDHVASTSENQLPLNLDEERTWDVLSFPKGREKGLRIWREKRAGVIYKVILVGNQLIDSGLALFGEQTVPRAVKLEELPDGVAETGIKAAGAIGAVSAEITLQHSEDEGKTWVLQVDPSPDFYTLEINHGLTVSEALAKYLIAVAV
jgi:hypothetical protein